MRSSGLSSTHESQHRRALLPISFSHRLLPWGSLSFWQWSEEGRSILEYYRAIRMHKSFRFSVHGSKTGPTKPYSVARFHSSCLAFCTDFDVYLPKLIAPTTISQWVWLSNRLEIARISREYGKGEHSSHSPTLYSLILFDWTLDKQKRDRLRATTNCVRYWAAALDYCCCQGHAGYHVDQMPMQTDHWTDSTVFHGHFRRQ